MANPIVNRVVDKIIQLQGSEGDEVERSYWEGLAIMIIEEFLQEDEVVVDAVGKAIFDQKSEQFGGDWNNIDENRKDRLWKEPGRYVLRALIERIKQV